MALKVYQEMTEHTLSRVRPCERKKYVSLSSLKTIRYEKRPLFFQRADFFRFTSLLKAAFVFDLPKPNGRSPPPVFVFKPKTEARAPPVFHKGASLPSNLVLGSNMEGA